MTNQNYRAILDLMLSLKNKYSILVDESLGQKDRQHFIKWNGKLRFISRLIAYFRYEAPTLNQLEDILGERINYCLMRGRGDNYEPKYKTLTTFYMSQAQLACQLLVALADLSGGAL